MSTAAPTSAPTVAESLVRLPAAVREVALLATGVLTIALLARVVVSLPFTPVPLTGQTWPSSSSEVPTAPRAADSPPWPPSASASWERWAPPGSPSCST
ncbi:MAG: hypothetical protein M3306_29080 [Actinomycetota bacterium]|nr:hypothetical protein [Actinomycetota bacterium]